MKLCVSTKTHHIIAVDLGIYFAMFSSHYSKNFCQKSTKRVPPTQRVQDPPISQEEELERGRYGGLTRREKGAKYVGPFVGHFSVAKRCSRLMRNIDRMNLNEGRGLSLGGVSKLPKEHDKPVKPVSDDKWYMPSRGAWVGKGMGGDWEESSDVCVTSMRKTKPLNVKNDDMSSSHTHSGTRYPIQCILPPADDHVTSDSALLYLHYNNGLVIAYYDKNGNGKTNNEEQESKTTNLIIIYKVSERYYSIAK